MEKGFSRQEVAAPVKVTIKEEALNDDIKEFAETAMNELLGWYGYSNKHKESRPCRSQSHSGSNSSGQESPKLTGNCKWCGKSVDENTALSSAAATFCSELCFSQSRRANFKKNKTCDWCRHVRHTVSYVDSQDGTSQLQFCSDKCLNQYKMHIFWRETRAHLELHPHLHGEESSSGTLITPDLWMTKCKSPDTSTPSPQHSPKPTERQQTSPLPLITVAHPSKLMSQEMLDAKKSRYKLQKKAKKKVVTANFTAAKLSHPDLPQDLRTRHTPEFDTSRLAPEQNPLKKIPQTPFQASSFRFGHPQCFSNNIVDESARKLLSGLMPPPTVLVPYPLILPLPIPIPIPIPLPLPSRNNLDCREVASQTEKEDKVDDEAKSQELPALSQDHVQDNTHSINVRPLRKRKRVFEKKTRLVIKNKKIK